MKPMTDTALLKRMEYVKAMDTLVMFLNDEEGMEAWLSEGCCEHTDDEYFQIAFDDTMLQDLTDLFLRTIKHYSCSGFYVGGKLYCKKEIKE